MYSAQILVLCALSAPLLASPFGDPVPVHVQVNQGRAVLVRQAGATPLSQMRVAAPFVGPGHLEVAPGSHATLQWRHLGSIEVKGPAAIEWKEPTELDSLRITFATLQHVDIEVRSMPIRVNLPGDWRMDLEKGAYSFHQLGGGGVEVNHRAGGSARLSWMGDGSIRTPLHLEAGQQIRLLGTPEIERRPDLSENFPGWDRVAWPWGEGPIAGIQDLALQGAPGWKLAAWPWEQEELEQKDGGLPEPWGHFYWPWIDPQQEAPNSLVLPAPRTSTDTAPPETPTTPTSRKIELDQEGGPAGAGFQTPMWIRTESNRFQQWSKAIEQFTPPDPDQLLIPAYSGSPEFLQPSVTKTPSTEGSAAKFPTSGSQPEGAPGAYSPSPTADGLTAGNSPLGSSPVPTQGNATEAESPAHEGSQDLAPEDMASHLPKSDASQVQAEVEVAYHDPSLWRGLLEDMIVDHVAFRRQKGEGFQLQESHGGGWLIRVADHSEQPYWYFSKQLDVHMFPGSMLKVDSNGYLHQHMGVIRILSGHVDRHF